MGGATNPAKMALVGSRMDLGLNVFSPDRKASRSGAGLPPLDGEVTSGKKTFLVPEFGYNRALAGDMAVGLTVYGNGGMNTTYPQGSFACPDNTFAFQPANALCGSGELGVNLEQLVVAPTFALKVAAQHALGASLLLGYQRFKASGLQAFTQLSSDAAKVTNNGTDTATGWGLRLGWIGEIDPMVSVGIAYSTKINMSRFDKYRGLFAEGGDFDIPSNYSAGIEVRPMSGLKVAVDLQRINYSDVASVSNPSNNQAPLGSDNGPGFGWKDITVFKIGASWQATPALTVRAGYNRGENPIRSRDVTFNILAPGVMTDHYTAGFTLGLDPTNEITGALMVAPRQSVSGSSMFNGLFPSPPAPANPGGTETISMKQYSIGVAWGHKF
jgi:long-chain fatty acid transport protein